MQIYKKFFLELIDYCYFIIKNSDSDGFTGVRDTLKSQLTLIVEKAVPEMEA